MVNVNDLISLISQAEQLAIEEADGHLTIMRFTTGWKCALGTPDLRGGDGSSEISQLQNFETLTDALSHLISEKPDLFKIII
jgi:hypothetical protein